MRYCCHVFLPWGGVGPTVGDLPGVRAPHVGGFMLTSRPRLLAAFIPHTSGRSLVSKCLLLSSPGAHIDRVPPVSEQRESRIDETAANRGIKKSFNAACNA